MKKLNYIELKLGAKAKRGKRLDWIDGKLRELTAEREAVLLEIARDSASIEALEKLTAEEKTIEDRVAIATQKVYDSSGEDAKIALAELTATQQELDDIGVKIRGVYYDR